MCVFNKRTKKMCVSTNYKLHDGTVYEYLTVLVLVIIGIVCVELKARIRVYLNSK